MVNVTEGNEKVTVPTSVRDDDGNWSQGTAEEPKRDVLWRRLQAGQDRALLGGQFQTPMGRRYAIPFDMWGWLYIEHNRKGVPLVRFLLETEEQDYSLGGAEPPNFTLYVWEPDHPENGLAVSGSPEDFKHQASPRASNGVLTVGWEFSLTAPVVADQPVTHEPRLDPTEPAGHITELVDDPEAEPEAGPIDPEEEADGVQP